MSSATKQQASSEMAPLVVVATAFRMAEFAFAAIVVGIDAWLLDIFGHIDGTAMTIQAGVAWDEAELHVNRFEWGRIIYTEAVACLALILAFVWLLPLVKPTLSPVDFLFFIMWMVAFGLIVTPPSGGRFRETVAAFCFLSSIFWLVSFILGIWYHNPKKNILRNTMTDTSHV